MDAKPAFRYAGYYFLLTAVATGVGLSLVAAGYFLGIEEAYDVYVTGETVVDVLPTAAPGLLVSALGLVVWKLGTAWAFFHVVTGAVREELSSTYDTERVKSEILSVLDDRLSEMQSELRSTSSSTGGDDFEF